MTTEMQSMSSISSEDKTKFGYQIQKLKVYKSKVGLDDKSKYGSFI